MDTVVKNQTSAQSLGFVLLLKESNPHRQFIDLDSSYCVFTLFIKPHTRLSSFLKVCHHSQQKRFKNQVIISCSDTIKTKTEGKQKRDIVSTNDHKFVPKK